jgi:superfamily I DNA and RNA helicase
MLDIAFGEANGTQEAAELVRILRNANPTGTLYIGYPLLSALDGRLQIDALLTCEEFGVVAFDLSGQGDQSDGEWAESLEKLHNDMFIGLETKLKEHRELRSGRRLAFDIRTMTLAPRRPDTLVPDEVTVATPVDLLTTLMAGKRLDRTLLQHVNAAIQTTSTMKPRKKRTNVARAESRGAVMKVIESQIANLDRWQKRAAIEYPDGPQRIRGLAGSGKTIVLAQKAALLHARHPDWQIAVTFNTRSLYQQFQVLIRRFHFELTRDDPDWSKLRVMHAWGSAATTGVYAEIARANGRAPKDFSYAKGMFGSGQAFRGVCGELLQEVPVDNGAQLFDLILIDEAQDLPQEFFQLVYGAMKPPKRIVWAYDELQNLGEYSMPSAEVVFGNDSEGRPRVKLQQERRDQPRQDIILPVCYRNTPWALTVAHGLGFGIYRPEGVVQMFDDVGLWREIGYEEIGGALEHGTNVVLRRRSDASPTFFEQLLKPEDAVSVCLFENPVAECEWVAQEIKRNLAEDELEPDDILIIVADPLAVKSLGAEMMRALQKVEVGAHIAGVTSSRDVMFLDDSVAITGIYRAKGNEAPMVYVIGADACFGGWDLSRKRNILFTAITRSRAWVRVCGVGRDMEGLQSEIAAVRNKGFQLEFQYPTEEAIRTMKRIHRDRSNQEVAAINRDVEGAERLLNMIENGEIALDSLPEKIRAALRAGTPR